MTATDELRRLLDGRGVVHVDYCGETAVRPDGGYEIRYYRRPEPNLVDAAIIAATPAQAVEATLGRGTCRDANNRFNAWTCSECGATLLLIFDDYDEPSFSVDGTADVPHYCPNCGAKVVGA